LSKQLTKLITWVDQESAEWYDTTFMAAAQPPGTCPGEKPIVYTARGSLVEILMLMKNATLQLDRADHIRCLQSGSAEAYLIPRVLPAAINYCQNFLFLGITPGRVSSADLYLYGDILTGRKLLVAATLIHLAAMESCGYGPQDALLKTTAFPSWVLQSINQSRE